MHDATCNVIFKSEHDTSAACRVIWLRRRLFFRLLLLLLLRILLGVGLGWFDGGRGWLWTAHESIQLSLVLADRFDLFLRCRVVQTAAHAFKERVRQHIKLPNKRCVLRTAPARHAVCSFGVKIEHARQASKRALHGSLSATLRHMLTN